MRHPGGSHRGFALTELLVAGTVTLILAGALLSILGPGNMAFRAQPALTDMQQRLRFASDVLAGRLMAAGGAPAGGLSRGALAHQTPCLLPYRIGHRRADPPGTWRSDAVSAISGKPGASVAFLLTPLAAGASLAEVDVARCPAAAPACGIAPDTNVFLLPGGGQADLYRVETVLPSALALVRGAGTAPRAYAAGTPVVPVDIDVFYLQDDEDGLRLMRYDGWESDLPLLDHVASLAIDWFGAAEPPRFREETGEARAGPTYGPAPPHSLEDAPGDDWGAGENCVFSRTGAEVLARLPTLGANALALVPLNGSALTDGPWCGPAGAGFDADLLRVRRVRLSLAVEAAWATTRGADPHLYAHPGTGRNPHGTVPDLRLTLDIVPRSLGGW